MAPISSAGNFTLPATQPTRNQPERSASVTNVEEASQQEASLQRVNDEQRRRSSEQVTAIDENKASSSVTQADDEISAGEQQKIEVAQQEAQRAEFNQQAGNVRETEPNDVRPSSDVESDTSDSAKVTSMEFVQVENPAIDIFVQLQNIDTPPRQGQEVNRFA